MLPLGLCCCPVAALQQCSVEFRVVNLCQRNRRCSAHGILTAAGRHGSVWFVNRSMLVGGRRVMSSASALVERMSLCTQKYLT